MRPDLESLLQAFDAFQEAPRGSETHVLKEAYEAELEETAARMKLNKDLLNELVMRYHPRWVRANLPPGFPKDLGLK